MWTLYLPLSPYYIYLSFKAKSFGFFNATNPGIKNGGLSLESKIELAKILPKELQPNTIFYSFNGSILINQRTLEEQGIFFPVIVKPDLGCRGKNVVLLSSYEELQNHLKTIWYDVVIQNYIDLPEECGIFYCRYPNEKEGFISGIVYKKGIEIIGDGVRRVEEILLDSSRYEGHVDSLKITSKEVMGQILSKGESICLSKIGNHSRGATFYDYSHSITPELTQTINAISLKIEGFYYGRFDIKYHTWQELNEGKNIQIIELNGAGSESTHMYDPKHSYLFALLEMKKHWKIMYEIAGQNKKRGYSYLNLQQCWNLLTTSITTHNNL